MNVLYVNNFRGFSETYLSFGDVNFFVGENSTGKTSLLKLIGIISSQSFWNYQKFKTDDLDLGNFAEIKSIQSDKEFFQIGILEKLDANASGIKLTFIEKESYPYLKEICYINDRVNIQITIDGNLIRYRYKFNSEVKSTFSTLEKFKKWILNSGLNDETFHKKSFQFFGINSVLFHLQSIINFENDKNEDIKLNIPNFVDNIAWSGPARTPPQKTYDSFSPFFTTDGAHAPYILRDIINNEDVQKILKRFGDDSGLFDDVEVYNLKHENLQTDPFEILLKINNQKSNIINVGYGISQILPIIVEVIGRPENSWFAIQQPEVHLHPRAQAAFGDFLHKSIIMDRHKFIVETHSDYIIDRLRLKINKAFKKGLEHEVNGSVFFFEKDETGNKVTHIELKRDGSFPENQPEEFRSFFIKEQMNIITI